LQPSPDLSDKSRWRTLALLAIAELFGMSLWFSGSAVVPALTREWHLSPSAATWLTLSVQLGFVVGTLLPEVPARERLPVARDWDLARTHPRQSTQRS